MNWLTAAAKARNVRTGIVCATVVAISVLVFGGWGAGQPVQAAQPAGQHADQQDGPAGSGSTMSEKAQRGQWWPDSWYGRSWVLFGLLAQVAFTGRFLVQWIASEKRGRSHVPIVFWYLSLVGGIMLLLYAALWKHDPVVTLGQSTGVVVYVRNLMLLRHEKRVLEQMQTHGNA